MQPPTDTTLAWAAAPVTRLPPWPASTLCLHRIVRRLICPASGRAASLAAVTSLAEALRYGPDATLLLVACDDLGLSYSSNVGVYDALRSGMATTAGLMVPCPWAREAASRYRGEDVGVHLTLNCEFDVYRWGPITQAPSLLDGDGGFPRTLDDVWDHADVDEVRRECRAQIERAILWGFDVSHLSSHLGALEFRPEFFDVALELCVEFGLPMRLSPTKAERSVGFPFRQLAAEEGIISPDNLVRTRDAGEAVRRSIACCPTSWPA